jgi:hypothetical protein
MEATTSGKAVRLESVLQGDHVRSVGGTVSTLAFSPRETGRPERVLII